MQNSFWNQFPVADTLLCEDFSTLQCWEDGSNSNNNNQVASKTELELAKEIDRLQSTVQEMGEQIILHRRESINMARQVQRLSDMVHEQARELVRLNAHAKRPAAKLRPKRKHQ